MKCRILNSLIVVVLCSLGIFCVFGFNSLATADEQDLREIHCKHFIYGIPLGTSATNDLMIRDIYALSSNDSTKFADWVAYRLDPETVVGDAATKRVWKADPWLADEETFEPEDYKGAHKALKTDRGHQAPLASFKGTRHWQETNYLSNITPQKSDLNQGPWRRLEEKVRSFVKAGCIAYILAGPFYEKEMPKLPGADEGHRIPSEYWKIIIYQAQQNNPNTLQTAAYIFPQQTPRTADISRYLVAIGEVEKRSGLDVLSELPDGLEDRVEYALNTDWAMQLFYR